MKESIVYYGGSFDPIHKGHLEIISELSNRFETVLVLPCINWMKNDHLFSIYERYNSVKECCKEFKNVIVLDWSINDPELSKSTFDVCEKIKSIYKKRPFIVIGSDTLKNISKWKKSDKLKDFDFIIFNRNKTDSNQDMSFFKKTPIYISRFDSDISSSQIRKNKTIESIPEIARSILDLRKLSQK